MIMYLNDSASVAISMDMNEKEATEPCSCGFHYGSCHSVACPSASFSLLFAVPPPLSSSARSRSRDDHKSCDGYPSVDCTLSLRTPSTRQTMAPSAVNISSSSSSCTPATSNSKFYWSVLQGKQAQQQAVALGAGGLPRNVSGRGSTSKVNVRNDPLLARRCANCDTTSTPLWRNGPRGPKSLCNACGIRYKRKKDVQFSRNEMIRITMPIMGGDTHPSFPTNQTHPPSPAIFTFSTMNAGTI